MEKNLIRNIILLYLVLNFNSCTKEEKAHEFPLASEHNINEGMLISAYSTIEEIGGIASFIVCRDGVIVAERYYNGYNADSIKTVMSVTKTITAMLVGLAIEKGFIDDINDPISKYLAGIVNFPDDIKAKITIEQLLRMSFGHSWNGTSSESLYNEVFSKEDHLQAIIDLPLVSAPGTEFNYSDGASHLLSVIITEASGINTLDFAIEYFFHPMEITFFSWGADDKAYPNGASSLRISPHDMVKIGNLLLNHGRYKNLQIVPESWIKEITNTKIITNNDIPYGPEYGYQIWINNSASPKYFFAMGWGGQFIFIVPDQKLVVTASNQTAGLSWQQAGDNWFRTINVIVNDIFPAVE